METKIIKINLELKQDLEYVKFCKSEELSYELREIPLNINIEKEWQEIRNQIINKSISGCKIISTESRKIYNIYEMTVYEEITINFIKD